MVEDVIQGLERTLEKECSSEGSTDQEDLLRTETCDKQTNTITVRVPSTDDSRSRSQGSSKGRNSSIRRSQTFSPACRPVNNYVCKVRHHLVMSCQVCY